MQPPDSRFDIASEADLLQLFDAPKEVSLVKELDRIDANYAAWIAASPFFVLCTAGSTGLDASPRGDAAGFVQVQDSKTLVIPDRRGNNRIDSLRNLMTDSRVALLFLIPGLGETLRVNGGAGECECRPRHALSVPGTGTRTQTRPRGDRRRRLLSVLAHRGAEQPLERRTAHSARQFADTWQGPQRRDRGQDRWRRLRSGAARPHQVDTVLKYFGGRETRRIETRSSGRNQKQHLPSSAGALRSTGLSRSGTR